MLAFVSLLTSLPLTTLISSGLKLDLSGVDTQMRVIGSIESGTSMKMIRNLSENLQQNLAAP